MDYAKRLATSGSVQDREDEVAALAPRAPAAVQTRGPHDQGVSAGLAHEMFASQFGSAIDVDGVWRILLRVRLEFPSVEHIVRADIDATGANLSAGSCHV
jgi:hypothetical protein